MPRGKVESTIAAAAQSPSSLVISPSRKLAKSLGDIIPETVPFFGIVRVTDPESAKKKVKKGDKLLYFSKFLPTTELEDPSVEYKYDLYEFDETYVAQLTGKVNGGNEKNDQYQP